jgi:nucleotide-binding universal stress UspA family protein
MLDTQIRLDLKNVLFPTDFSSAANTALPYAAEIARRYGANLYAMHVLPSDTYVMTPQETWSTSVEGAMREAKQEAYELLCDLEGVKAKVLVRFGDMWTVMEEVIGGCKIDLIVLGTHGRTG